MPWNSGSFPTPHDVKAAFPVVVNLVFVFGFLFVGLAYYKGKDIVLRFIIQRV